MTFPFFGQMIGIHRSIPLSYILLKKKHQKSIALFRNDQSSESRHTALVTVQGLKLIDQDDKASYVY